MNIHKIIYLLWPMIILSSSTESNTEERTLRGDTKHKRQVTTDAEKPRPKKLQHTVEKSSTPDDDEDKKTLAQQVLDGKYGLIQTELFSNPVKRPGIISYEVNPEVPKDNVNNLGGLKPEEIWLAENHLLVIKGGGFTEKEQNSKVAWPPIDNYIAPKRQVKIPPNPKVPPPFPIQLKDGGPIEVIKGKNNTKSYPPYFNGGPFGSPYLFPLPANMGKSSNEDKPSQGNFTEGNGGAPFPYLPPGIGLYPPAIAFLPPPGNLTELDEDDPRIYYPPKYDFVYKKNYSSHVPPGPLVPGIILPPPPSFFAPLENTTRSHRPNERNKLTNSIKKLSKNRLTPLIGVRQKVPLQINNNFKIKSVPSPREHKIPPIHVINNDHKNYKYDMKINMSSEEWVPIPAPRPSYITDLNKLKALANSKGNDPSVHYNRPKNGWDYENNSAADIGMKIQDEFTRMNNFKNSERENKKVTYESSERNQKNLKSNVIPLYYTSEKNENNIKISLNPQFYTTEITESKYKSSSEPQYYTTEQNEAMKSSTPPQIYTAEKNKNKQKPSVIFQYETTEKNLGKLKSNSLPKTIISSFVINSPSTLIDEESHGNLSKSKKPLIANGKLHTPLPIDTDHKPQEQFHYDKPLVEINTLVPENVYNGITIKTPSANGRIILPSVKYGDEYRNTVKPSHKPLSVLYYEQESKYQADDSGYSYDAPVNPYRAEQYQVFPINHEQKVNKYTTTTKKPPIYEYSYTAPGYGTLESPKVGNNLETTPKPVIFQTNFKPIKPPQFSYFEYQSAAEQNEYKPSLSTPHPPYSTPQTLTSTKAKYQKIDPYQTENPYASYHTHDIGLLDDITKKYFSLFGQKISPDGTREITTSLPKTNQNYYEKPAYKNYKPVSLVPTKVPSTNVRFPEVYNIQSDRPYYDDQQEYSTPKYRLSNRQPKPNKPSEYSYYYSSSDPGVRDYEEEVVRPDHPLDSDIAVNYKIPSPHINPDAELINPAYYNQAPLGGNSYISYRLPGNSGHFYFLTPQTIQQHNYPLRNSRIRYTDIDSHGYIRDLRHK